MAPTATSASAAAPAPATSDASAMPGSLEEANQRYLSTKSFLKASLAKKRTIDRSLTDLESQIYLFEGSYLASTTSSGGNIVKGFDAYLKNTGTKSTNEVPHEDRIFSLSSATYQRSLELKAAERDTDVSPDKPKRKKERDERSATPGAGRDAASTPSKAAAKSTPSAASAPGTGAKLKRKNDGQTPGGKNKRKKEDE